MKLILVFESRRLRALQRKHALLLTVCHEYRERYEATLRRAVNAEDIQTSTVEESLRKQAKADAEIARLKQELDDTKRKVLSWYNQDERQRGKGALVENQVQAVAATFYGPKELEHNPDGLTPEQYGMGQGYRLLDKDEILPAAGSKVRLPDLEEFQPGPFYGHRCWEPGVYGDSRAVTYRTRLTREQLRAARGL